MAASVVVAERGHVGGLVDADAARRDGDHVGDRVAAHYRHHRVERDRDPIAGQEHGDHAEFGQPRAERRQEDAHHVLARAREDRAALLGPLDQAGQLAPEDANEDDDQQHGAGGDREHQAGAVVRQLELALERARYRREQIHVDEPAGEREEDLLHEHAAKDTWQVRARDDRDEHQQHHERADVGRQEAVQRDAGGVGREHLPVRRRRVADSPPAG